MHQFLSALKFTSKLESMFNDIKTSQDSMRAFKAHQASAAGASAAAEHDIDLSVQVRGLAIRRGASLAAMLSSNAMLCARKHFNLSAVRCRVRVGMFDDPGCTAGCVET